MKDSELKEMVGKDLLFDFYGELLTERRKRVFEKVVFDDCSVSEVGRDEGISRQGVHDLIRRATEQLESCEEKLKLVGRFRKQREIAREIYRLSCDGGEEAYAKARPEIQRLSRQLMEI